MNWYARIAPFYNLICRPLYAQLRTAAVDALQLSGNECVVEIGCGTGLNIAALSKKSRQVIAVQSGRSVKGSRYCTEASSVFGDVKFN